MQCLLQEVLMRKVRTAHLLLSLLLRRPQEFWDQMGVIGESRLDSFFDQRVSYEALSWGDLAERLEATSGDLLKYLDEPELPDIEEHVRQQLKGISHDHAIPVEMLFNADILFARLCYAATRHLKPTVVVETGVAYGVTASFILKALAKNGHGMLYSVELPPLALGADRFVGITVPDRLKSRWQLRMGATRRVMPKLFKEVGLLELFVHDSLHTYWNMRREFDTAWAHLTNGGMLIADDITGNWAFEELKQRDPAFWGVCYDREDRAIYGDAKHSQFGVVVK
jgi:hypothetical protein